MTNLCSPVWHRLLVLLSMIITAACQTTDPQLEFGLQAKHQGVIPARIAVLPCQAWALALPPARSDLQAAPRSALKTLCQQYDLYILKSFAGQPFMKGFTPALIQKLLTKAGKPTLLSTLRPLWLELTSSSECKACANAPSVYHHLLANSAPWRTWLQDLSRMTHYSDAVLLPFVQGMGERQYNDRGLLVAERQASLVLLLIDTNNGALLWSGGQQAKVTSQQLGADPYPPYPDWNTLTTRLLHDKLWREFPGKQWY